MTISKNRILKFRAWSKEENKMLRERTLQQIGVDHIDTFDHLELMQFTGLHDKNGKEIYEGDITEDILGYRFTVYFWEFEADWHTGTSDGENKVIWFYNVGKEFWLSHFTNNLVEDAKDRIVIWNIYENPELLTK